jgi:hypothetical protein
VTLKQRKALTQAPPAPREAKTRGAGVVYTFPTKCAGIHLHRGTPT